MSHKQGGLIQQIGVLLGGDLKNRLLLLLLLMKRLFNMKMSEGGSVADHLNEFNTLTIQLSSIKVNFDDEVRALLILGSLPKSWNSLVCCK